MNDHELAELRRLVRQQDERLLRLENQLRGVGRSRTGFSAGPGVNVIGQDTEIHGDLTVSGAIHGTADAAESVPWAGVTGKPTTFAPSAHSHTGLIVGFDPPIKIYDATSITAGTHNIYLPDYGVSGYSWVFVIVGGRTSPAGPYMHVRKYGKTEMFVACDNPSSTDNIYASGWCPVASNRITLYASASFEIVYFYITAAKI